MADNVWWQKGNQLGIGSLSGGKVSVIVTTPAVRYFGVKYADDFTTDKSLESNLPSSYHRALLAGVMRNFAEDDGDYKMAAYWNNLYEAKRREGKKEANIRKDGTPTSVIAEGY